MSNVDEKRNSMNKTAPESNIKTHQADLFERVGGRQALFHSSLGGGRYQNKCNVLNFDVDAAKKKRDPRIEELKAMGLHATHLEVAENIGVDAFLKMWRIYDRSIDSICDDGRLIVRFRRYKTFLRYQRNRFIESMLAIGMKPNVIREKIESQLCEKISRDHITKIARRG